MSQNVEKPSGASAEVKRNHAILHVSDLHFGRAFNAPLWSDLLNEVEALQPSLIILTGDLVNSPWDGMIKGVKERLSELQAAASIGRGKIPVCVVPGNHDTRLFGLFPISWVWVTSAAFVLAALLAIFFHWGGLEALSGSRILTAVVVTTVGLIYKGAQSIRGRKGALRLPTAWFWVVAVLIAAPISLNAWGGFVEVYRYRLSAFAILLTIAIIVALVARSLVSWKKFVPKDSEFHSESIVFPELGIGVLAFDSSPRWQAAANGKVGQQQLVDAKRKIRASESSLTWIAAVHHHPLPLAYSSGDVEGMLFMEEAGTFVRTLGELGVRMVLHGHKHRRHFVRLNVDPSAQKPMEIGILSAGTPTEGKSQDARHSFNVLRFETDETLSVENFEAPTGGTFQLASSVKFASLETFQKTRFAAWRAKTEASCTDLICITRVNEYGDANFLREFRGVRTTEARLMELPGEFKVSADGAHIEWMRADRASDGDVVVQVKTELSKLHNEVIGRIAFPSQGLRSSDAPTNFTLETFANNAFALNRRQYRNIYPNRTEQEDGFIETMDFRLRDDLAVNMLTMMLMFSGRDVPLPAGIKVDAFQSDESSPQIRIDSSDVVRLDSINAIQVTVRAPKPGALYRLHWVVPASSDESKQAARLREALESMRDSDDLSYELVRFALEELQKEITEILRIDAREAPILRLYCFHPETQKLECVTSTLIGDVPSAVTFGRGIVGKAFKAVKPVAFSSESVEDNRIRFGYLDEANPMDSPQDCGIEAYPLCMKDSPHWPVGVLEIVTKGQALLKGPAANAMRELARVQILGFEQLLAGFLL